MPNTFFRFKKFTVQQERSAMKVCTDACLFGAWVASLTKNESLQVLDIGTGTGLLALMIAQQTTGNIDAVEIEEGAWQQAVENVHASPWRDRIHLHHTSIQSFNPGRLYDLILSNPPFFQNDLKAMDWEKNIALHSTALSIEELLHDVKRLLAEQGTFAVLLPFHRSDEFEDLVKDYHLMMVKKWMVKQTPQHHPFRVMYLLKNGIAGEEIELEQIVIKDENNHYTPQFISYLENYYLFDNINIKQ